MECTENLDLRSIATESIGDSEHRLRSMETLNNVSVTVYNCVHDINFDENNPFHMSTVVNDNFYIYTLQLIIMRQHHTTTSSLLAVEDVYQ